MESSAVTYLYENSNPDRFQQFAQSLLLPEYPGMQCFPVGQADGGRDALVPDSGLVVQVKFKRKDEAVSAQWMISTLEAEMPKIERLQARGAKSYLMVTNASMTGPLDSGSYDLVQNWIDENLPIPGQCLWRDDLDRRFDLSVPSFKLKYSEMLAGEDAIGIVLNELMGPSRKRQVRAVRAFVDHQYGRDLLVKFKQLNMSNGVFDLFVDVSLKLGGSQSGRRGNSKQDLSGLVDHFGWNSSRSGAVADRNIDPAMTHHLFDRMHVGAAAFLLGEAAQQKAKRIVLQGAPGQGKSTLAQYVCQIHRAKFLDKGETSELVPDELASSPFRVPVKVDLRDLAAYLSGNAPFAVDDAADLSLEGFLAGLVRKGAGGLSFSVDDVVDVVSTMPTLLFLDGLDEVADMKQRQQLVNEVVDGIQRFDSYGADLQVVVTSRPSVFGRAPSFSGAGFLTFRLDDLHPKQITKYSDKWVIARGLDEYEVTDLQGILKEKLKLPHIQDLTKNPMQLAILLSLIHSEGPSLPDQRTDLYQRYIDLFLTREAEKDKVVAVHRKLLIAFVQRLAWTLQSQAESARSSGAVSIEELRAQFDIFLRESGNPEGLAEELFTRGLERIFVLVERIEGTFEFEVQPIREFFCAGHLFETSPYGAHLPENARGDRAHRFEAMAKNPFWANVVRFYSGSWHSGEIPALVMSLKEIIETGSLAEGVQARRVGMSLLTDWIFSSKKFAQRDLINLILDDIGIEIAIGRALDSDQRLRLDPECGQDVLRERIFEKLSALELSDPRDGQLCFLLKVNGSPELLSSFQNKIHGTSGVDRTKWFGRLVLSGADAALSPSEVWNLATVDGPDEYQLAVRVVTWLNASPGKAAQQPDLVLQVHSLALAGRYNISIGGEGPLEAFLRRLSIHNSPFERYGAHFEMAQAVLPREPFENAAAEAAFQSILDFHRKLMAIQDEPGISNRWMYHSSPHSWSLLIEVTRGQFGELWPTFVQAATAAGISTKDRGALGSSLVDAGVPLYKRARAARLKRGSSRWWIDQIEAATTGVERLFALHMTIRWAPLDAILEVSEQLSQAIASLPDEDFDFLDASLRGRRNDDSRADRAKARDLSTSRLSGRAAHLVALTLASNVEDIIFSTAQISEPEIVERLRREKRRRFMLDLPAWSEYTKELAKWLEAIAEARSSGEGVPEEALRHLRHATPSKSVITKVLEGPGGFPVETSNVVFETLETLYRPLSVGKVAASEKWTLS